MSKGHLVVTTMFVAMQSSPVFAQVLNSPKSDQPNEATEVFEATPGTIVLGWADWVGDTVRCYKADELGRGRSCSTADATFPIRAERRNGGTRVSILDEDGNTIFFARISDVRVNTEPCFGTKRSSSSRSARVRGFSCVNALKEP